jgi:hypothetical protein
MKVGDVVGISEIHAASIFDPENGRRKYLRNVGNIAHIHTV